MNTLRYDGLRLVPIKATRKQLEDAAFNLSAEIGPQEALKLAPHIERAYELLVAASPARFDSDKLKIALEALNAARKVIEMFRDADLLSEGVHTGLRKGTDAHDAHALWTAISSSKTNAWGDAIEFALEPYFSMWGGDAAIKKIDLAISALQQEEPAQ